MPHDQYAVGRARRDHQPRGLSVLQGVGDGLGNREVRGGRHGVGQRVGKVGGEHNVERRASGELLERGTEAELGQHRRANALGQLA
jgi:hypothetical protein